MRKAGPVRLKMGQSQKFLENGYRDGRRTASSKLNNIHFPEGVNNRPE
jgi:hypothetical protein